MWKSLSWQRLTAATGSALLGGLCGCILTAFGNTISSSRLGMGTTVVLTALLGGLLGRFPGALLGGMGGVLLVAFGSLIGGSVAGVVLTILVCTLLGGWLRWAHDARGGRSGPPVDNLGSSSEEETIINYEYHYDKELV